ncbi:unnamed protein product, partial [Mesorhabditis spiculigera]
MGNNTRLLGALLLVSLAAMCAGLQRKQILGFRVGGMRKAPPPPENMEQIRIQRLDGITGNTTFTQKVCHFNPNNTQTWQQFYFYNYKFQPNFQNATNNVAFLMIGGEGPESDVWSTREDIPYMQWAAKHKAAVFDLEHRFYGQSQPFKTQSVDNLKYLSSRQALEDIADFIRFINKQNGWTGTKWVVFGGSYSGALAAWFRQLHPELAIGAVGSSGPVQATVDFYQYLQVVENSLAYKGTDNAKGWQYGSDLCLARVKDGFAQLVELMKTKEGRDSVTAMFKVIPSLNDLPLAPIDFQNFYSLIFGNFQGAVQYSNDRGETQYDSIASVCNIMTNTTDGLVGLVNVNTYLNLDKHGVYNGIFNNYTSDVQELKDETYNDLDLAAARSWIWQTCTEFGYYQTTDYTQGVFGSTAALSMFIQMCQDVYGIQYDSNYVTKAVKATNDFYGGAANYKGSNVVLPNGDLDPWHALGRYQSDFYSQTTFLIEGSAHCGDMYPPSNGDTRYDVIHPLIARHIDNWLNGPPEPSSKLPYHDAVRSATEAERLAAKYPTQHKEFTHTYKEERAFPIERDESKDHPVSRKVSMLRTRPRAIAPEVDLSQVDATGYSAISFTQPLCHFNNKIPNTFQQRWWKNTQWAKPGGPNFLMIGGEGPANPEKWVLNGNITYLQWAQQYGATIYYMEHRCYGESHDLGNSTFKTDYVMLFCNSWQSLWDIRQFISTVNYREGNTAPWITFGGSYSGMLSLWARNKFPDLIAGAVGSSAPINVKLDFFEYLTVTSNSLRMYDSSCADKVQDGFSKLQQLALTPAGLKTLSDTFTLSPAWDVNSTVSEQDKQFFFSNIYGNFQGAVQYAGDNTAWYANNQGDIGSVCAIMKNNTDSVAGLAAVNKYMWSFYADPTDTFSTFNDYNGMIKELRDLSLSGADRTWTYQTCVEFGFYQSTDAGRENIFGSVTPVNIYLQMCYDIFGNGNDGNTVEGSDYSTKQIQSDIDDHYNFFTATFNVSNIAAPNGGVDPWHALGLLATTAPGQTLFPLNATAHCADMYPPRDSDPADLKAARTAIGALIGQWISGATGAPPTVVPTGGPGGATSTVVPTTSIGALASLPSAVLLFLAFLMLR